MEKFFQLTFHSQYLFGKHSVMISAYFKEFIDSISKQKNEFDKTFHSFKLILVDDENLMDGSFFYTINHPKLITVDFYNHKICKYLIVCIEKFIIFIAFNKISSFFSILNNNPKLCIITLSNTVQEFIINYNQQNNSDQQFNIQNCDQIPFLREEIMNFILQFPFKFKNKDQNNFFKILLSIISAFLIRKAHLNLKKVDRIKDYYENTGRSHKKEYLSLTDQDYIVLLYLTSGTSSSVRLIYYIKQNRLFVMKSFNNNNSYERELSNYMQIDYPFIAKFYGTAVFNQTNCIILEYIDGFSFSSKEIKLLSIEEKLKIVFQLMISFNYLHKKFIIRDIHPNNLFIDQFKKLVMIDFDRMFGVTEVGVDSVSHIFLAPESCEKLIFTKQSDIYSLGKIIQFLFEKEFKSIKDDKLKKINHICEQCTQLNPNQRASLPNIIKEFLSSFFEPVQFINDIDDDKYKDFLIYLADFSNQHSFVGLAKIYENGSIFPRDIKKVIYYYSLAVDQNDQEARVNLQVLYNEIKENKQNTFGNVYNKPRDFQSMIQNKTLHELYSKFNFLFYNSKLDVLDFIKEFKFIVLDFYEMNSKFIVCVEGLCIIIDYDDKINEFFTNTNESIINICENHVNSNLSAIQEVSNFCEYFQNDIKDNVFVSLTIKSISAYIIRRYFYPSIFFKDSSFFSFDKEESFEYNIKKNLYKIRHLTDNQEIKSEIRRFLKTILKKKAKDRTNCHQSNVFKLTDFILLRKLHSSNKSSYYLAFYIPSFYIFLIKRINDDQEEMHLDEINFVKTYSHLSLCNFYGFISENSRITGFVYEYMCNGSLKEFILNPKHEVSKIFSISIIIRAFECIFYFQKNSINNRIININNIFLDHNCNPFICFSDQPLNDGNLFLSLKQIVYFVYEKKELDIKNNKIKSISNCSSNINELFNLCDQFDQSEESLMMKLFDVLYQELTFSHFFDYYIVENGKLTFTEIIDITYEMISFVSCLVKPDQFASILLSFFFNVYCLFLKNKGDITEMYFQKGIVYKNGNGVKRDYNKSKECFEFCAKNKNPKALMQLGIMYENGYGVEQNYNIAIEYYKKSAELNYQYSYYLLGCLYEKGNDIIKRDHEIAKEFFIKYCENYPDNSFQLGLLYENGDFFEKDNEKAIFYYELAAKLNHPIAMCHLGVFYLKGKGLIKNYIKAKEYFQNAIKQNNPDATGFFYLGYIYEKGFGVDQNDSLAIYYYEKAAEMKYSVSYLHLGKIYFKKYRQGLIKDLTKANECFLRYIYSKSDVLLNIGIFYENGQGVPQDYSKARLLYELSAHLNNLEANLYLGYLYENGNGVKADQLMARKYFDEYLRRNKNTNYNSELIYFKPKKANQLHKNPKDFITDLIKSKSFDLYKLGRFCQKGYGIKKDVNLAVELFKISSLFNNSNAMVQLGNIYGNGIDLTKDIMKAKNYYEKAAHNDNSIALYKLGLIYEKNDIYKAKYYYELSANLNNADAQYKLGQIYYKGLYVEKDYRMAEKYFESSSQSGNNNALLSLGNMYYYGKGVKQNYVQGINYYKRASQLGNVKASLKLGIIYYNGKGIEFNIMISMNYYVSCINIEKRYNLFNSSYYYHANNDLGLIYLVEYQQEKVAEKYLSESGYNEYPIGQNSYGIFLQYYCHNENKAKQMFENASELYSLALSEYNLGHLYEKNNEIYKSIIYYIKASEHSNIQLIYRNEKIKDEMFQISQELIVCFVDFKLFIYFLKQNNLDEANKHFFKAISNKQFLFPQNDFVDVFFSLKQFLLKCYLYIQKVINNDEFKVFNKNKLMNNSEKSICSDERRNNQITINDNNLSIENILLNENSDLFVCLLNKTEFLTPLQNEINTIIQLIEAVLYHPPFSILLGRINYHNKPKQKESHAVKAKNEINESFYEGLYMINTH